MTDVAVVGAGPAGIAATAILVGHGLRPVLIDESPQPGGQVFRRPSEGVGVDLPRLLGADHARHRRFHAEADRVAGAANYRPRSLAWAVHGRALWIASPGAPSDKVEFKALVLATGATDRTLPVRGWTLPGVYALGGAQALLKGQGCAIGRRVVFCGSSPLMYLAAVQFLRMGAGVAAVLDTTRLGAKVGAVPAMLGVPGLLAEGLGLMWRLKRAGVRIEHGVQLEEFAANPEGGGVAAVRFRDVAGREQEIGCDAVALGYGLRPESQLADLVGCAFQYDAQFRQWFPVTDADLRGAPGVYLAGDGAAIGGAEAAAVSGALAAATALSDLGIVAKLDQATLRRRLGRLRRFQAGLARAFAWPAGAAAGIAADVPVCRCEAVTAGELRGALDRDFGADEMNRLKAQTRCGMGRCQGRFCEIAAAEIAAARPGRDREAVGRLRGQAPVKPLPLGAAPAEPD